ncbi:MAG TPA: vanadium-dependent haloperoxidase [Vicinamibacterales bacterium]
MNGSASLCSDLLAAHGLARDDPGVLVGQQAASGILVRRENDGRYPAGAPAFNGGTGAGMWRPTPPQLSSMAVPWLSAVRPFTLNSPSQFRAEPPPRLDSARYARDYDEVKTLGASNSVRTPEQTDLAYFWAANYGAVWNRVLRDLAALHVRTIGETARLFALANIAAADAVISAWDSKRHYVYWRPITAIQEGENDGNPRTVGDRAWQPLIPTPNYPDYTSGANVVTAAMTRTLALFFGAENMTFSVTNEMTQGKQKTRSYTRFSDASDEVVEARIYEGIHFRFADEAAQTQGRGAARWVFERFLRPARDR